MRFSRRIGLVGLMLLVLCNIIAQPISPAVASTISSSPETISQDGLCWRMGYDTSLADPYQLPDVQSIKAGIYLDWSARYQPIRVNGMEYIQTIRLHQKLSCGQWFAFDREGTCPYSEPYEYLFRPNAEDIQGIAQANPGSIWQIGNEPDRKDWSDWGGQDEMLPEVYARAFHELREIIIAADPTARISIAPIIFPSPVRLDYLSRVWDAYLSQYGQPMAVDVWNIHMFILREEPGNYGAEVPPGFPDDYPDLYIPPDDCGHIDTDLFAELVRNMRQWMVDHGQQDKPLILTEFGVLYWHPSATGQAWTELTWFETSCWTPSIS